VVVVSPDGGGAKRAELLRETLAAALGAEVRIAILDKRRTGGVVGGEPAVIGGVEGASAVVVDDLISTGSTLARAATACCAAGALDVHALVTHGLFTGDAAERVAAADCKQMVVTNTVPPFRLPPALVDQHLTVLDAAPLVAEAIRRLHREQPLEELRGFGLTEGAQP
jgi:ribose-phosphate pyrophosphokinase